MNTLNLCKTIVTASVISLVLMHAPAQAVVNFDLYSTITPGSSFISGDYTFDSSSHSALVNGNNYPSYGVSNGTNMLVFNGVSGILTVSRSDHGLFELTSLDVGGWFNLPSNNTARLSITGHTLSSGDVSIDSGLSTTTFSHLMISSFTNLTSMTMKIAGYSSPAYVAIDNLVVTAVPEPESYAMLLAGLGLMGAIARRRRKIKQG